MTSPSLEEKRRHIFDHEQKMARLLALRVLDKPEPPLWASFIPMIFVFYAQKLKQYSTGLDDFVDNYLVSRRQAMDAAVEARALASVVDARGLLKIAGDMPPPARPLYMEWISRLAAHYETLLDADGACREDLVRKAYRNKDSYLSCWNRVNEAEQAFNLALLPDVDGEADDVRLVVQRMNIGIDDLRRQDADAIFPS